MSGDAEVGKSYFTMEGGSLTSSNGDMIYVTNTSCEVRLTNVAIVPYNGVFLKVVGNDARTGWGVVGKNGGQCVFTADHQDIAGDIIVDKISTLDFSLTSGSTLRGTINNANSGGSVTVHIDETSKRRYSPWEPSHRTCPLCYPSIRAIRRLRFATSSIAEPMSTKRSMTAGRLSCSQHAIARALKSSVRWCRPAPT